MGNKGTSDLISGIRGLEDEESEEVQELASGEPREWKVTGGSGPQHHTAQSISQEDRPRGLGGNGKQ